MHTIKVNITALKTRTLVIGYVGENERTQVRFECEGIFTEFPHAAPSLAIKPPVGDVYPVVVSREENEVVWDVSNADLQHEGAGELQLTFVKDGTVAKTVIGKLQISRSLLVTGEQPDVIQTWYDAATEKLADVDAAIYALDQIDAVAEGLTEGSAPTVEVTDVDDHKRLEFGIPKGDTGEKGDPFVYDDFTPEQLEGLRGPQGLKGDKGDKGDTGATPNIHIGTVSTLPEGSSATARMTGTAENPVLSMGIPVGATGAKGDKGNTGDTGNGIQSIAKTGTSGLVDTYTITYTSGNTATFTVTNGQKGDTGDQGIQGETGNGIASIAKTGTDGYIDTYTITFTDGTTTTFEVANGTVTPEQMAQAIEDALEDYARIDGYYQDMTVGDAEQLISSKYVENSEPYTFRTSGGSSDIGNREYLDAVVGVSLPWNQLVQNGNFENTDLWYANGITLSASDNVMTLTFRSATPSSAMSGNGLGTIEGHKYLVTSQVKFSKSPSQSIFIGSGGYQGVIVAINTLNAWVDANGVFQRATGGNDKITFYPRMTAGSGWVEGDIVQIRNLCCFDLTQMFGTAVADYIYSLETATAGAGVALFRSWFPKNYYEYNPGELLSVEGLQSHDMVGFNQWDGEWVQGYWDKDTGAIVSSYNWKACKNFIPVIPNTAYYFKREASITASGGYCIFYDADKNYLTYFGTPKNASFTTPANAYYMTFCMSNSYFDHLICVNLAHNNSRNGEYEPYEKHSYPLDSSVILRGIPKVGSNGVYWDGDRYLPDGTIERRYGVVDMGTLTWIEYAGYPGLFYVNTTEVPFKVPASDTAVPNAVVVNYLASTSRNIGKTGYTKGYFALASGRIYVANDEYAGNPSEFNVAIQGVLLVYELATPTTETAQPYHSTQWVSDWGTEEFVSTGLVPVGHETRYPANLRDKLQHLPDAASGNGSYLITQTDGQMVLTPFPAPPSTAGNYVLKATVTGGVATYTWEVAT